MSVHLFRQMQRLKKSILRVGAMVEEAVQIAVDAVETRDMKLAQQVIDNDHFIDEIEIDVEDECLHSLACYQPVAQDLRFVIAVLKINNDLERIGDLAVSIAEQAQILSNQPPLQKQPFDLSDMAAKVQSMLKRCLDALVNVDHDQARSVCETDHDVDDMYRQMYDHVESHICDEQEDVSRLLAYFAVSRRLERIADHATNIAEDVVYLSKGDIVRHGSRESAFEEEPE